MTRFVAGLLIGVAAFGTAHNAQAQEETRMWATKGDLKRRTCPSIECGIVGHFYFRESVLVYEVSKGWARISRYKTAGCYDGASEFVQSGRNDCSKDNGIASGEFAEWVRLEFLAKEKPQRASSSADVSSEADFGGCQMVEIQV